MAICHLKREINRLLKNDHLLRFPHPSSLRRTAKYASLLRISGALHLALFEQPGKDDSFSSLLKEKPDDRPQYGDGRLFLNPLSGFLNFFHRLFCFL
jgi:hypothetical protein